MQKTKEKPARAISERGYSNLPKGNWYITFNGKRKGIYCADSEDISRVVETLPFSVTEDTPVFRFNVDRDFDETEYVNKRRVGTLRTVLSNLESIQQKAIEQSRNRRKRIPSIAPFHIVKKRVDQYLEERSISNQDIPTKSGVRLSQQPPPLETKVVDYSRDNELSDLIKRCIRGSSKKQNKRPDMDKTDITEIIDSDYIAKRQERFYEAIENEKTFDNMKMLGLSIDYFTRSDKPDFRYRRRKREDVAGKWVSRNYVHEAIDAAKKYASLIKTEERQRKDLTYRTAGRLCEEWKMLREAQKIAKKYFTKEACEKAMLYINKLLDDKAVQISEKYVASKDVEEEVLGSAVMRAFRLGEDAAYQPTPIAVAQYPSTIPPPRPRKKQSVLAA
jgi:hypothetical protein